MLRLSLLAAVTCLLSLCVANCQSQTKAKGEQPSSAAPKTVELAGVDTSKLTSREAQQWSEYVSELLAPCPDQPVSIAQCVSEKRDCDTCLPAAKFLISQVTRGKSRSQVETAFQGRFSPDTVKEIDLGDSPQKGADNALVTIVEWADFECPFCGMASPLVGKSVKQHPDTVRVVFKHYPLSGHEHAEGAARAAVAAGMQGKFWEMHDLMFKNQQQLDEKGILKLAAELGLDEAKFNADRKTEAVADSVAADRKAADGLGLRGTPMIYVNGRHFDLEQFDLNEDLEAWIELEIALRSGKGATGSAEGAKAAQQAPADQPASAAAEGNAAQPGAAAGGQ